MWPPLLQMDEHSRRQTKHEMRFLAQGKEKKEEGGGKKGNHNYHGWCFFLVMLYTTILVHRLTCNAATEHWMVTLGKNGKEGGRKGKKRKKGMNITPMVHCLGTSLFKLCAVLVSCIRISLGDRWECGVKQKRRGGKGRGLWNGKIQWDSFVLPMCYCFGSYYLKRCLVGTGAILVTKGDREEKKKKKGGRREKKRTASPWDKMDSFELFGHLYLFVWLFFLVPITITIGGHAGMLIKKEKKTGGREEKGEKGGHCQSDGLHICHAW